MLKAGESLSSLISRMEMKLHKLNKLFEKWDPRYQSAWLEYALTLLPHHEDPELKIRKICVRR